MEEVMNALREINSGHGSDETSNGLILQSENTQKIMLGLALVHGYDTLFRSITSQLGASIDPM